MKHNSSGLARPCNSNDLILVDEGLQCANCLAVEYNTSPAFDTCHATFVPQFTCPACGAQLCILWHTDKVTGDYPATCINCEHTCLVHVDVKVTIIG